MSARALITGASGFIGGALLKALHARGDDVTALTRRALDLPKGCKSVVTQDFSYESLSAAQGKSEFDVIYHLAAYGIVPDARHMQTMFEVNTVLPVTMARIAADSGARLVTAGSSAEYAAPTGDVKLGEAAPLCSDKLYGASKASGYLAAAASASALGVTHTHLRLFNVYGDGEASHRLLPSLAGKLKAGERVSMSDGAQVRDFIYIDDVCAAFTRAKTGGVYNVCTGQGQSVADFARAVCAALGADERLLGFGDIARRPDDIPYLVGAPDRATEILKFTADNNLKDGLAKCLSAQKRAA